MMAMAGLKPKVDSANSRNPMQFAPTSSNSTKNATTNNLLSATGANGFGKNNI